MLAALFWFAVIFILYAYLGYPALIIMWAKLKKAKVHSSEFLPQVTLLIPAYNEEIFIAEKLENSISLDYPSEKLQILVVADGSSDSTPDIVRKFSDRGVELAYIPERGGKMAAINRSIKMAQGEIVIFSDANNMYEPQTIRALTAPFADLQVGSVTGAKHIVQDGRRLSAAEGLYWRYESKIKTSETIVGSCTSAVGEMLAVRHKLFQTPPKEIVNDDHYIILDLMRRGYKNVYTPDARSFEYVSLSAADEVVRRSRMNAGLFQTISLSRRLLPWKHPLWVWQLFSHKFSRAFVPFMMLLALITNFLLVFSPNHQTIHPFWQVAAPFSYIFLGLQILFYILAVIGHRFKFGGLLGKLLYLPTFLVNSNQAVLSGLYSFWRGEQSHIWQRVQRGGVAK